MKNRLVLKSIGGLALRAVFVVASLLVVAPVPARPSAQSRPSDDAVRKSLVQVKVSSVYYNQSMPWLREAGRPFTVLGLVVPGERILVLANDIRNASLLEVTRHSSYEPALAEIERMDVDANLALLKVDRADFFEDLLPLPVAERDPTPGQSVRAVKIDEDFRVYRETNQISAVNVAADFGFARLPAPVFRSSEPFSRGGLLLCGRMLCGFIGYSDREKQAEAIPPSVFGAFRRRAQAAGYVGFAAQGFALAELVDPVRREYYGLNRAGAAGRKRGALVTEVLPGTSAYGALQREDVLLSVAGADVDERGLYADERLGPQEAALLFNRRPDGSMREPGERIALEVYRDRRVQRIEVELRAYERNPQTGLGPAERIPYRFAGQPPYLVENGVLFVEFSAALPQQLLGGDWRQKAIQLAHLYQTKRFYDEAPAADRIVLLAGVFPDDATRGYDSVRLAPLAKLDGRAVVNLERMHARLEELAKSGRARVSLELADGRKLFLNLKDRDAINARIQRRYGIPQLDSFGE